MNTPIKIPEAIIEAVREGWPDSLLEDYPSNDDIAAILRAAFSVCWVHENVGIAFDDNPTLVHTGSSLLTDIMGRQHKGESILRHEARSYGITTPGERIDASVPTD